MMLMVGSLGLEPVGVLNYTYLRKIRILCTEDKNVRIKFDIYVLLTHMNSV